MLQLRNKSSLFLKFKAINNAIIEYGCSIDSSHRDVTCLTHNFDYGMLSTTSLFILVSQFHGNFWRIVLNKLRGAVFVFFDVLIYSSYIDVASSFVARFFWAFPASPIRHHIFHREEHLINSTDLYKSFLSFERSISRKYTPKTVELNKMS